MGKKNKKKSATEPETSKSTAEVESAPEIVEPTALTQTQLEPEPVVEPTAIEPEANEPPAAKPETTQPAKYEAKEPAQPHQQHSNGTGDSLSDSSLHQKIGRLAAQLEATELERDDIQDQYDELYEKVEHIKATLGQRLRKDAAELAAVKAQLQQLQAQHTTLKDEHDTNIAALAQATKEKDVATSKLAYAELQLGTSSEQTASFESRITQLTQDAAQQTSYAEHFRKSMLEAVQTSDNLKQELGNEIKSLTQELAATEKQRETLQQENATLKQQITQLESQTSELGSHQTARAELEETIREKNIIIGKLRHEAVILNEHLTNALRIVKKDSEGQTVDKELVSNLIIQFVQLPRGDTKKFEVLQLIANFLSWDEDRRIEVGLAHTPGQNSLGGFLGKFAEFMERESRKN